MPEWINSPWLQQLWTTIAPHLPAIALSIGILVGGWIVAIVLRAIVFAALKRTTLDNRIAEALGVEVADERIERGVATFVYYVALAFVIVAFLERLHVSAVTTPIVGALEGLSTALPSILKALLIGFVGYLAASGVRRAVVAILDRTALVSRVEKWSGLERAEPEDGKSKKKKRKKDESDATGPSETIGAIVFWTIIVLTAIPVLEALKIGVLAAPLSNAITVVSTYLPKVLGAAVLAAIGYFLGRAARAVITAVVDKTGVDKALGRVGLSGVLGEQTAGSILGNLAMAFIFLHFAISAVGRLDIQEISGPLGMILTQIYAFLPRLLVGGLLLAVGIAVARIASGFVRGVLAAVGFNTLMEHIGLYKADESARKQQEESKKILEARLEGGSTDDDEEAVDPLVAGDTKLQTPADIGGVVVAAVIVLLFLRQALETMGLTGLASMFDSLIGYLPDVLVAAVVLGAGMWAGGWAKKRLADVTSGTEDRLVKALPAIVHGAIVTIASMVALQQLGVGNQIIAIAFTLILGAVCLALALAFGLGGRTVAGEILAKEYNKRAE